LIAGILSLSGIVCAPLIFVGPVLGVIALFRGKGSKGWAVTAVVVPLVWIPLAFAICWPMFHADQKRQRTSECRSYLKQAFTVVSLERSDHGAYSTDWEKIGFSPEGHLRYAYFFSPDVVMTRPFERHPLPPIATLKAGMPKDLLDDLGPHGDCATECWMTVACAGDIFEDGEVDVWSISTRDRPLSKAGELLHHER
jgi:type IV pilus assembly protein PilA